MVPGTKFSKKNFVAIFANWVILNRKIQKKLSIFSTHLIGPIPWSLPLFFDLFVVILYLKMQYMYVNVCILNSYWSTRPMTIISKPLNFP